MFTTPPAKRQRDLTRIWQSVLIVSLVFAIASFVLIATRPQPPVIPRLFPPPPEGKASFVSSGPFREEVSDQEMPVVHIVDQRGPLAPPATFVFTSTQEYRLVIDQPEVSRPLPAGTYGYQLQGPHYALTGLPDQFGTFTCRRFRRYELALTLVPFNTDRNRNLGD